MRYIIHYILTDTAAGGASFRCSSVRRSSASAVCYSTSSGLRVFQLHHATGTPHRLFSRQVQTTPLCCDLSRYAAD